MKDGRWTMEASFSQDRFGARTRSFVHVGSRSSLGHSAQRWNTACYELLYDWLEVKTEAFQIERCAHDVISPCPKPPRTLPHPARRAKKFSCDVALQDLNIATTSDRLLGCMRQHLPTETHKLIQTSQAE